MKKIAMLLFIIVGTILISACQLDSGKLFNDDSEIMNEKMDEVLDAIKNKNSSALKEMFSINTVVNLENFDDSINELFDFFEGDIISYDDFGNPTGSGDEWSDGEYKKNIESTYDIVTSVKKYRMAIYLITDDTVTPENIGIQSIYIIEFDKDPNSEFAYWGYGKDTPGININKIYEGKY